MTRRAAGDQGAGAAAAVLSVVLLVGVLGGIAVFALRSGDDTSQVSSGDTYETSSTEPVADPGDDGGSTDDVVPAVCQAETRMLEVAEEAHYATESRYATMDELVGELIRERAEYHDITVTADGTGYELVGIGICSNEPTTTSTTPSTTTAPYP